MNKIFTLLLVGALTAGAVTANAESQIFKKKKKKAKAETEQPAAKDSTKSSMTEYKKLLKGAKTIDGMFKVHIVKDKYYFEIPKDLMGRDFMIASRVSSTSNNKDIAAGQMPRNPVLVTFSADKKKIYMHKKMVRNLCDTTSNMYAAFQRNFSDPIWEAYKIESLSPDSSAYVIDMSSLFITDVPEFSPFRSENIMDVLMKRKALKGSLASSKSTILGMKCFPLNINIKTLMSYTVDGGPFTVTMTRNIILLPEEIMRPRYGDSRIGYFDESKRFYTEKKDGLQELTYINRWDLQPKPEDLERYKQGELVEPQKPIVYYVDTAIPDKWRDYIKKGIEDWQTAFEKAGFKNAIIAKEITDSMHVDMDDVNYSVLTYAASEKKNAMGPSLLDPRSGEILEADIMWWHNVLSMVREWITVQTGTVCPEARSVQLPDSLMGDAIRFVACHEVGHSLGLRHNMMGSWAFPTDSLRSAAFTSRMNSTASSIMDYARFNYIAQPGDGVTVLSPHIGPYDMFAIEYGYRWYGKNTPEEEKDILFDFLSKHTDRLYKYSEAQDVRDAVDPRAQNEDLGDDPVRSSQLGIANLKRIVPQILQWTTTGEKGQTYEEASRLYYAVINQWNNYLYHVLANIGGIYIENTIVGDGVKTYTFVEKEKQQAALKFLMDEVLTYPKWLFDTEVGQYTYLLRNTPIGKQENAPTQILKNAQAYILWDLLGNTRLMRMIENESVNGKKAFTVVELMDGLHKNIFGITERGGIPNVMERSLQKNFLDALLTAAAEPEAVKINKKIANEHFLLDHTTPFCSCYAAEQRALRQEDRMGAPRVLNFYGSQLNRISDAISVKRGELLRIKKLLQNRLGTSDTATRYHYEDMILRINTALGIK